MSKRRYVLCQECRRRIMLPRWAEDGIPWTCMDCSGESPRELIEWANDDAEAKAEQQHADHLALNDPSDKCVRDDSTECNCSRCGAAEDEFWRDFPT